MDNAVVLAENVFGSTYGKTANGLVRYSKRYNITSVIDSRYAGNDAGKILSGKPKGIPMVGSVEEGRALGSKVFIVGIATDGGYIPEEYRKYIMTAINEGMTVVSGLHEFISDDPEFSELSRSKGTQIIDVRKMFRDMKMPFTGSIREVKATKIAVLGTDSAIGKRTTSVFLNQAMNQAGKKSVMIGTGQTSWMQGFPYTVVVDSMINDFIPGNLEWITHEAWVNEKPDYMFLEGQGSVLHPAYPGSFEIIGACRPDAIILQHAPKRKAFDGFEEFPIPPLEKYINILENLSNRKVIAISINSENMDSSEIKEAISCLQGKFGIPVFNPLEPLDSVAREIQSLSV